MPRRPHRLGAARRSAEPPRAPLVLSAPPCDARAYLRRARLAGAAHPGERVEPATGSRPPAVRPRGARLLLSARRPAAAVLAVAAAVLTPGWRGPPEKTKASARNTDGSLGANHPEGGVRDYSSFISS